MYGLHALFIYLYKPQDIYFINVLFSGLSNFIIAIIIPIPIIIRLIKISILPSKSLFNMFSTRTVSHHHMYHFQKCVKIFIFHSAMITRSTSDLVFNSNTKCAKHSIEGASPLSEWMLPSIQSLDSTAAVHKSVTLRCVFILVQLIKVCCVWLCFAKGT